VGPALEHARSHGALVLVKETLANGRLAARPPAGLVEVAERHGVAPDTVAVGAVLAQPWADTVLVGPASPAQLASNLGAAALRLTDRDREQLATLAEPGEDYWSRRSALPWH
jgi:aryl-alcohol dehydrogenase-like predicted oxidoreductase